MENVMNRAKEDPEYTCLLQACLTAEIAYKELAATWNTEQRQIVERYLSACEELDHRLLILALEIAAGS